MPVIPSTLNFFSSSCLSSSNPDALVLAERSKTPNQIAPGICPSEYSFWLRVSAMIRSFSFRCSFSQVTSISHSAFGALFGLGLESPHNRAERPKTKIAHHSATLKKKFLWFMKGPVTSEGWIDQECRQLNHKVHTARSEWQLSPPL